MTPEQGTGGDAGPAWPPATRPPPSPLAAAAGTALRAVAINTVLLAGAGAIALAFYAAADGDPVHAPNGFFAGLILGAFAGIGVGTFHAAFQAVLMILADPAGRRTSSPRLAMVVATVLALSFLGSALRRAGTGGAETAAYLLGAAIYVGATWPVARRFLPPRVPDDRPRQPG